MRWVHWALVMGIGAAAMAQSGFSTKTPTSDWLHDLMRNSPALALGAAGKAVWLPGDAERWQQFDGVRRESDDALFTWWTTERWQQGRLTPPRWQWSVQLRGFAARQIGERTTWEHFDAFTLTYHPDERWGAILQLRHRDPLPLTDTRPVPTLEIATVRGFIGSTVWEFGRNYHRWGPGFWGTPLLSDTGYPLDGVTVSLRLKLPLVGRWRVRQLMAYLHGDRDGRFLLVRRWEKPLGTAWHIGFTECNISRSFPPPTTVFLPFYPASRLAVRAGWRTEGTDQVIVNGDVQWRQAAWTLYGAVVVDDIRLPFSKKIEVQQKLGWIFGAQWERPRWTLGAEFAHFDQFTYTHTRPVNFYDYHGIGLGYPTGPDSRLFSVWLRWQWHPRWQLTGMAANSFLNRHDPAQRDREGYWTLSLQWAADRSTLLALHWTRGFPPIWGLQGGWSEQQERQRFLLLEVRWRGLGAMR
ncbi:hypothetical protein HRbin17_02074 [bacterium HR17]|uniref:Capsule assembly protein Wzi n=1 Tax=Candidatus Fervidibacter japonicus TaxID=2035412 RepID=A0A2H5XED1_9BACT|nr:hypothetical protein HRbin17_02074 [bacterium HR17]